MQHEDPERLEEREIDGVDHPSGDNGDDSIATLLARLIEDAERFVRAELRLYRADLFSRISDARNAIILGLIGFLLAQSAMIAMLVGMIVILRPSLGAIGATLMVVGGAIAIAAILARLALSKINRATQIEDKNP